MLYIFGIFFGIVFYADVFAMEGFRKAPKVEVNRELFKKLPSLETSRLFLRPLELKDSDDLNLLLSDKEIAQDMVIDCHASKEDTQQYIQKMIDRAAAGESNPWAIIHKSDNKLIGYGGISSIDEVGTAMIFYALLKEYWGNKLMPEALKKIIECGFNDMRVNRIEGYCVLSNTRSARVMEKAGMRHEGTLRECAYGNDGYWSSKLYAILKTDFLKIE